jgi:hypothetical protein
VRSIAIDFQNNALVASNIDVVLRLPGFDKDVEASASLSMTGGVTAWVTNLAKLGTMSLLGIANFTASTCTVSSGGDGPPFIACSGKLTPTLMNDAFAWPAFDIQELRIDTAGNISFAGGWLNLPKAYCIDIFGFQLELTKIAFGTEPNNRRWFGLSGALKLIDGMPPCASAEGLKISWEYNPATNLPNAADVGTAHRQVLWAQVLKVGLDHLVIRRERALHKGNPSKRHQRHWRLAPGQVHGDCLIHDIAGDSPHRQSDPEGGASEQSQFARARRFGQ